MEREERYLVIKRKDIANYLTPEDKCRMAHITNDIDQGRQADDKPPLVCAVIESDWPMYEQTWKAVEDWVDGKSDSSDDWLSGFEQLAKDLVEEAEAHFWTSQKFEMKADNCKEAARKVRMKIDNLKTG